MIVVSDASPMISLAAIGRLDLLRSLYGTLVIPRAIYREIVEMGAGLPGAVDVQQSDWIETRDIADPAATAALLGRLDRGEAEAIVLACELKADLLLMDERKGREE